MDSNSSCSSNNDTGDLLLSLSSSEFENDVLGGNNVQPFMYERELAESTSSSSEEYHDSSSELGIITANALCLCLFFFLVLVIPSSYKDNGQ